MYLKSVGTKFGAKGLLLLLPVTKINARCISKYTRWGSSLYDVLQQLTFPSSQLELVGNQ